MILRPPSATVSTHISAFDAVAFQSPFMPNARMSLCTQSVHFLLPTPSSPHCALLRFPNTTGFDSRRPFIRMSVHAHKSLLVRKVFLMLSHRVYLKGAVIRGHPTVWSLTRLGGVRCGVCFSVFGGGSTYCIHTGGPRLPRLLPFGSWGRALLLVGRRAHVVTAWCASSMRGSACRFQRTYPGFRSRRPLGTWRITPVCIFSSLLRLAPSSAVYAVGVYTWSLSSLPTWSTRRLGELLR